MVPARAVQEAQDDVSLYPIRTVASLTGVSVLTLRAWERRYGLVRPMRTAGGHRVYTRADIDTIFRVLALVDSGVAIGQVKQVIEAESSSDAVQSPVGPWAAYQARLIEAVERFDEPLLDDIYNEMLSMYSLERVTREALFPLLVKLGERWSLTQGGIAQEHFLAVFLRNKFGALFHHRRHGATGPKLVVACLPGEHHEVGILLFSLAAHERGCRLVLLGADMPTPEVAHAAGASQADAVVLSGSVKLGADWFAQDLPALIQSAGVPVFVGGSVSLNHHAELVAAGAVPLGRDIDTGLKKLLGTLTAPQ